MNHSIGPNCKADRRRVSNKGGVRLDRFTDPNQYGRHPWEMARDGNSTIVIIIAITGNRTEIAKIPP